MPSQTLKTVYCCFHDAAVFGETPVFKTEIHHQGYISHKQLVALRHRMEVYIIEQLKEMNRRPEYNGAWPGG